MTDSFTPNLRLTLPETDIRNWQDKLRNNFRTLDAAIGTYLALSNLQGPWTNSTAYTVGQNVVDSLTGSIYTCQVDHTSSPAPTTFTAERIAHTTYWRSYSQPATFRGAWTPSTSYALNQYVFADQKYAIALSTHTSGSTFAADLAAGKWGVLVDGTVFGAALLPTPSGVADANKLVGVDGSGVGYVLKSSVDVYSLLSATTLGQSLLQTVSAAAARAAIGAADAATTQPLDSFLTSIAAVAANGVLSTSDNGASVTLLTVGATGQSVLADATAASARSTIGAVNIGGDTLTGPLIAAADPSVALGLATKQYVDKASPIGALAWWPTDTPPSGYLVRDGSLISRTTYAALFAVLVTAPGYSGQTFTVTIASPGVVTKTSHGFTGGERLRLSTTGALPTGLDTTSDFFVIYVDANTFQLATSEANAAAGTAINTTGSQSGTHTYTRSLFGLGDGSTTFKLPDDRDLFIRGKASSGRAIGSYRADAIQGHRHKLGQTSVLTNFPMRNALGPDEGLAGVNNGAGSALNDLVVHDPVTDGTNGTPRTASETRPVSRAYLPIIKYI